MFNFNIVRIGQSPNVDWMRFAYFNNGKRVTLIEDGEVWGVYKRRKRRRLTPAPDVCHPTMTVRRDTSRD